MRHHKPEGIINPHISSCASISGVSVSSSGFDVPSHVHSENKTSGNIY
jgi:hypothetical protein